MAGLVLPRIARREDEMKDLGMVVSRHGPGCLTAAVLCGFGLLFIAVGLQRKGTARRSRLDGGPGGS